MTKTVQFNNDRVTIGTKADLTKLAIKHAVVAADTGDLSKAIVKMEQVSDGNLNLHNWPPAIAEMKQKFEAFRTPPPSRRRSVISCRPGRRSAAPRRL